MPHLCDSSYPAVSRCAFRHESGTLPSMTVSHQGDKVWRCTLPCDLWHAKANQVQSSSSVHGWRWVRTTVFHSSQCLGHTLPTGVGYTYTTAWNRLQSVCIHPSSVCLPLYNRYNVPSIRVDSCTIVSSPWLTNKIVPARLCMYPYAADYTEITFGIGMRDGIAKSESVVS